MTEPRPDCALWKVIIITHEFDPFRGGVAVYTEEIARAIKRQGSEVTVWAPKYPVHDEPETYDFCMVRLGAKGNLGFANIIRFAREFAARRKQFLDSTVVLTSVGAHMGFMLAWFLGVIGSPRLISILHGSEILRFDKNPFWRLLARSFFPRVLAVAAASAFSKALIEKSFLAPLIGPVTLAPCACGGAAGRKFETNARADGKLRVLTIARIHPRKGQLDTARALAMLPADLRAKITYQVGGVGSPAYLKQVQQFCIGSGVPFEYLGAIPRANLAAAYAQCDIFAMTARSLPRSVEGFGIAYLEAGFHGKPAVAYRSGGAAEAVLDGKTGFIVEEGNLNALANAFDRLISNRDLRNNLGSQAQKHVETFSWETTARVILSLATENHFRLTPNF